MRRTLAAVGIGVMAATAACGSGPSPGVADRMVPPEATTVTTPPPPGVAVVRIVNGTFRPANLRLDMEEEWIVEWRHRDGPQRAHVVAGKDGSFRSHPLHEGDTFRVDFRELPGGLHRYHSEQGRTRIPGSVDTRPDPRPPAP